MPEDFPTRLRRLREKQHKSRVVLSELCGLHPGAIARYERGESQPTVESLTALADYFNVSVDYLIGRTETLFTGKEKLAWQEKKNPLT